MYQVWDTEFVEKALKEKFNSDPTVMADSILNNITVSTLSFDHCHTTSGFGYSDHCCNKRRCCHQPPKDVPHSHCPELVCKLMANAGPMGKRG